MQWKNKERKKFAQTMAEDAIVSALEELRLSKILEVDEVNYFTTSLGKTTGLLGLLPRKLPYHPSDLEVIDQVKHYIRRWARGSYHKRRYEMFSDCIVHRKKGHSIPEAWKEKLLSSSRAIGAAVIMPDTKTLSLFNDNKDLKDLLNDLDEVYKDFDLILDFQQFPGDELHPDDVQPHVIAETDIEVEDEKKREPSIVAFYDGGFIGHHHDDSVHSNALNFHNAFVKEAVAELLEEANGDMDDFVTKLEGKKSFKKSIEQGCVPRGAVLIVNGNGKIIGIQNRNLYDREFEWGWVSKDLFLFDADHKNVQPTHVEGKPRDAALSPAELMRQRRAARETDIKDVVKNKTDTATAALAPVILAPIVKLVESSDGAKPSRELMMRVTDKTLIAPHPAKGKSKKINFYHYHFGQNVTLPKDLDAGIPYSMIARNSFFYIIKNSKDETALEAALKAAKEVKGDQVQQDIQVVDSPPAKPSVPQVPPTIPNAKSVVTGSLLLISPNTKKKLMGDVLGKLTLRDPMDFKKEGMSEIPSVAEQLNYPFEDMCCWDDQSWLEYARVENGVPAAALLAECFRLMLTKYDPEFLQLLIDEHTKKNAAAEPDTKGMSPAEKAKARMMARSKAVA